MQTIVAVLPYIQIGLSIILIALVLMQRSDADLGSAFGSDSMGGTRFARRGAEKFFFNATIIIAVLFVASTLIALVFQVQ